MVTGVKEFSTNRSTVCAPTDCSDVSDRFRAVFRAHPAGVAVITADAGDGPVAMTATSVSSVSVSPNLLVFSASDRSSSAPAIIAAETLVIHFLGRDDLPLAKLAATSGVDRFADSSQWGRLDSGEPYYVKPLVRVLGRTLSRVRAGGATLLVVEALDITGAGTDAADPLIYTHRRWHSVSSTSSLTE